MECARWHCRSASTGVAREQMPCGALAEIACGAAFANRINGFAAGARGPIRVPALALLRPYEK
jgi:hypothetical protein